MMIEKAVKKQRKGSIGEHDVPVILEKYSPTTILVMLHEIAQIAEASKIDWNALVEKTSTGISSAREYQMLWRHLAYRDDLLEKLDDDAQPLDDDSDLEFELEAFPSVSGEASAEAAACVKVMIASGTTKNYSNPNGSTIEAPLTINIPNSLSSGDLDQPSCSMQGTNITVPVSVLKQPAPPVQVPEGTVANGSNGANFNKRKRKAWTEAEDLELIAAVQKYGETSWVQILRDDFKGDRTATQLSQRWALIRKRNGVKLNLGGDKPNGSELTESYLATRKAISVALYGQGNTLTSNTLSNGGTTSVVNRPAGTSSIPNFVKPNVINNSNSNSMATETSAGGNNLPKPQKPVQEIAMPKPPPVAPSAPVAKSRALPPVKKTVAKPTPSSSDARVRATAVAAGARIASPSDAASLLKAAQGKNAIHIIPTACGGSVKPATTGGASEANPNVHYIRTGLANAHISNYSPAKPAAPVTRHLPAVNGLASKQSSEVKTMGGAKAPESGTALKEDIQMNGTHISLPVLDTESKNTFGVQNPVSSSNLKTGEKDRQVIIGIEPRKAAHIASTSGRLVPQQINKMEEDAEKNGVNQNNDKGGEKNNGNSTNKVAVLPSAVAVVVKHGDNQNVNKMVVIPVSAVADGEKTGEHRTIDKMEIDRC